MMKMNKDKDFILQLQAGQCVSCGICAESCAYGAIRMGDFPEVDEEIDISLPTFAVRQYGFCRLVRLELG